MDPPGSSRLAPRPTKLRVMPVIVRHAAGFAATVSRSVRRFVLTGLAALCCSPAASAALLTHQGQAVTAGTRSLARLQAYPRTLVELDHDRPAQALPPLRRPGAQQLDPQLSLWRLPSWSAVRLLPRLERRGLVRSVSP